MFVKVELHKDSAYDGDLTINVDKIDSLLHNHAGLMCKHEYSVDINSNRYYITEESYMKLSALLDHLEADKKNIIKG